MDLLSKEQAEARIAAMDGVRVTKHGIEAKIKGKEYFRSGTLTIAVVTMVNGMKVVGQSACADPRNFDQMVGERLAYDDAVRQVWQLEGYLLRENLSQYEF